MKTRVTRSAGVAAELIRAGGVVAFPTETVYGLGASAWNEEAVRKIFKAKGRPGDNPLIVHVGDAGWIGEVARRVPKVAERLMEAFFPGALSLVLPKGKRIPEVVTAGLDTVGVRMPDHKVGGEFLRLCGVPVAAPSANRSGRPSPTRWEDVWEDLEGRIDGILRGGVVRIGVESTVVDCTVSPPVVLRVGGVTVEKLRGVAPGIRVGEGVDAEGVARSPGMKYRHYAPRAEVVLVEGPEEIPAGAARRAGYLGLVEAPAELRFLRRQVCGNVEGYARRLYGFLRACDAAGANRIYCQKVPGSGLGRAVGDRLARAAAGSPSAR
ncbi:MAG TPA: L-threonylcarbamoyladenylate synthase [Kiritimatiellia bacterium]|nr:L-threonylcarbamoyladenylate synthase [Kiritimatiellia bacterium]